MAQFDAVRLRSGDLVVVLQSDLVDHLPTRLVAPLMPVDQIPSSIPRLTPKVEIGGVDFIVATHLAATVPAREMGRVEASLAWYQDAIKAAIDVLVVAY